MKKITYLIGFLFFLNGLSFQIDRFNVRPDQVAIVIAGIGLFLGGYFRKQRIGILPSDKYVLAYLGLNILASVWNSPDPSGSLTKCLVILTAIGGYFIVSRVLKSIDEIEKLFKVMVAGAAIQVAISMIDFILYYLGLSDGKFLVIKPDYIALTGTMMEPNILGNTLAAIIVYLLASYMSAGVQSRGFGRWLLIASFLLVLLFSYTRGAWIGFLVGITYLIFAQRKAFFLRINRSVKFVALSALTGILIMGVSFGTNLINFAGTSQKFDNLLNWEEGTGAFRFTLFSSAIADWQEHWLLGNGADSFSIKYMSESPERTEQWWWGNSGLSANIFVQSLHDTGILGFLNLLLLIVVTYRMLDKVQKFGPSNVYLSAGSMKAVLLVIVVSYQTTGAMWLPFIWIIIGLCGVTYNVLQKPNKRMLENK